MWGVTACAGPPAVGASPEGEAARAAMLQRLSDHAAAHGLSGLSAACVLPDGEVVAAPCGIDGAGAPITDHGRFLSGSIGKTYAAAVALRLIDRGLLGLDDLVEKHLGDEPWYGRLANAEAITVRHLLQHTTGIREHVWKPEFQELVAGSGDRAVTPRESLAYALDDPPLFAPGEGFGYADTNYLLLGLCLEAVTGRSYWELLEDELLIPMGLTETGGNTRRDLDDLVCGMASGIAFTEGATVVDGRYFANPAVEYCGGGVHSTPSDLARWMVELFDGPAVPAALREEHRSAVDGGPEVAGGYGLGCFVGDSRLGPALGHSGIMPGFLSYALWFPELHVAVAVMVPFDDPRVVGDLRRLVCDLADLVARR